jgi:hypothetical protein
MGDNIWNRDAIVAEKNGFDCSKGHPAMGNYHHHQNPSAFNLDKVVISTVCNMYTADALYAIDTTVHAPLLGFAYDGYPIYGAYAYKNADGSGGITRMKSSYRLRSITTRTIYADGSTVTPGPPVNATYPLGLFREDYEYVATSAATPDYLDEHNGRFCKTPEYPAGTYAYFCTVDFNWNSAYPYAVGPTFYGVKTVTKVTSVTEPVTTYTTPNEVANVIGDMSVKIFPNPASDMLAVQVDGLIQDNIAVELYDMTGKCVQRTILYQGSTLAFFDTRTVYDGQYVVKVIRGSEVVSRVVTILR